MAALQVSDDSQAAGSSAYASERDVYNVGDGPFLSGPGPHPVGSRCFLLELGAFGTLTRRRPCLPTVPIFLQQTQRAGLSATIAELPNGDTSVTNYRILVRQETNLQRPRLRSPGAEPYLCPEHGFVRLADGRYLMRIRFPRNGMVTPMCSTADSELLPQLSRSFVPLRYQLQHRPAGWTSGLTQGFLPRSKLVTTENKLVPAAALHALPWSSDVDMPLPPLQLGMLDSEEVDRCMEAALRAAATATAVGVVSSTTMPSAAALLRVVAATMQSRMGVALPLSAAAVGLESHGPAVAPLLTPGSASGGAGAGASASSVGWSPHGHGPGPSSSSSAATAAAPHHANNIASHSKYAGPGGHGQRNSSSASSHASGRSHAGFGAGSASAGGASAGAAAGGRSAHFGVARTGSGSAPGGARSSESASVAISGSGTFSRAPTVSLATAATGVVSRERSSASTAAASSRSAGGSMSGTRLSVEAASAAAALAFGGAGAGSASSGQLLHDGDHGDDNDDDDGVGDELTGVHDDHDHDDDDQDDGLHRGDDSPAVAGSASVAASGGRSGRSATGLALADRLRAPVLVPPSTAVTGRSSGSSGASAAGADDGSVSAAAGLAPEALYILTGGLAGSAPVGSGGLGSATNRGRRVRAHAHLESTGAAIFTVEPGPRAQYAETDAPLRRSSRKVQAPSAANAASAAGAAAVGSATADEFFSLLPSAAAATTAAAAAQSAGNAFAGDSLSAQAVRGGGSAALSNAGSVSAGSGSAVTGAPYGYGHFADADGHPGAQPKRKPGRPRKKPPTFMSDHHDAASSGFAPSLTTTGTGTGAGAGAGASSSAGGMHVGAHHSAAQRALASRGHGASGDAAGLPSSHQHGIGRQQLIAAHPALAAGLLAQGAFSLGASSTSASSSSGLGDGHGSGGGSSAAGSAAGTASSLSASSSASNSIDSTGAAAGATTASMRVAPGVASASAAAQRATSSASKGHGSRSSGGHRSKGAAGGPPAKRARSDHHDALPVTAAAIADGSGSTSGFSSARSAHAPQQLEAVRVNRRDDGAGAPTAAAVTSLGLGLDSPSQSLPLPLARTSSAAAARGSSHHRHSASAGAGAGAGTGPAMPVGIGMGLGALGSLSSYFPPPAPLASSLGAMPAAPPSAPLGASFGGAVGGNGSIGASAGAGPGELKSNSLQSTGKASEGSSSSHGSLLSDRSLSGRARSRSRKRHPAGTAAPQRADSFASGESLGLGIRLLAAPRADSLTGIGGLQPVVPGPQHMHGVGHPMAQGLSHLHHHHNHHHDGSPQGMFAGGSPSLLMSHGAAGSVSLGHHRSRGLSISGSGSLGGGSSSSSGSGLGSGSLLSSLPSGGGFSGGGGIGMLGHGLASVASGGGSSLSARPAGAAGANGTTSRSMLGGHGPASDSGGPMLGSSSSIVSDSLLLRHGW